MPDLWWSREGRQQEEILGTALMLYRQENRGPTVFAGADAGADNWIAGKQSSCAKGTGERDGVFEAEGSR